MPKINLFALMLVTLLLSACQTGGGYSQRPVQTGPAYSSPQTVIDAMPTSSSIASPAQMPASEQTMQEPPLPPVKVGILLPLSGTHKALGDSLLKAAQIALFDIGHENFELIPQDTAGTAEGGASAAQAAVNQGAQIVLGPVFASAVRGAKPITQRARINMVAFSTDWTLAGGNTFIMGFLPFDQLERISAYAASQGLRRIGLITPQTEYGRIVKDNFVMAAPRYGMSITEDAVFHPQSNNLAPDIQKFSRYLEREEAEALNQTPFDAVMMASGDQQARAIANLLTHNALPPNAVKRLGTGLFDDDALASEMNLDGAWFAAPSPNARRGFESRFFRTFGERPKRLATLAYDATALSAVLAKRGLRDTGRPAFDRGALTNPNGFAGIDGIFRFRPNGTAERGLAILEYQHGQIVVQEEAPKSFIQNQPY